MQLRPPCAVGQTRRGPVRPTLTPERTPHSEDIFPGGLAGWDTCRVASGTTYARPALRAGVGAGGCSEGPPKESWWTPACPRGSPPARVQLGALPRAATMVPLLAGVLPAQPLLRREGGASPPWAGTLGCGRVPLQGHVPPPRCPAPAGVGGEAAAAGVRAGGLPSPALLAPTLHRTVLVPVAQPLLGDCRGRCGQETRQACAWKGQAH